MKIKRQAPSVSDNLDIKIKMSALSLSDIPENYDCHVDGIGYYKNGEKVIVPIIACDRQCICYRGTVLCNPCTTSTLKPTTSTLKPTTSISKPTTSTSKPTTSTLKPTTSTLKPPVEFVDFKLSKKGNYQIPLDI